MKLTLPFNKSMYLCGYKVNPYKEYWGYPHYGVDISAKEANGNMYVLASGDGKVLAAEKDNTLGGGIAILYKDCESRYGEKIDIVARYMHLSALNVKTGDIVKRGDVIGHEGKEGTQDYHLHLEFDTDTVYPTYSPQVDNRHTFWMKGIDTTVNPSLWLWMGDGQELVSPTYNPAWLNAEDFNIPKCKEENAMEKLPINENIPLDTEDGYDAHGEPVWAWVKKNQWLYIFDKYWRKIPTKTSDHGNEFASEEAWENAHPVTAAEIKTITEQVTDYNEYDEDGNVIDELPEDITPELPEEPEEKPVTVPTVNAAVSAAICRVIASAFDEIAVILDGEGD